MVSSPSGYVTKILHEFLLSLWRAKRPVHLSPSLFRQPSNICHYVSSFSMSNLPDSKCLKCRQKFLSSFKQSRVLRKTSATISFSKTGRKCRKQWQNLSCATKWPTDCQVSHSCSVAPFIPSFIKIGQEMWTGRVKMLSRPQAKHDSHWKSNSLDRSL